MGRIGVVLSCEDRTVGDVSFCEVKVDFGADDTLQCPYYPEPGYFGRPMAGDLAFCSDAPGRGGYVVTGTIDPKIGPLTATDGEVVLFSRSEPGKIAAMVTLKADGSIAINDGKVTIGSDGAIHTDSSVSVSGSVSVESTVSAKGDISSDGEVSAGSVALSSHKHSVGGLLDGTGTACTGVTGGPS